MAVRKALEILTLQRWSMHQFFWQIYRRSLSFHHIWYIWYISIVFDNFYISQLYFSVVTVDCGVSWGILSGPSAGTDCRPPTILICTKIHQNLLKTKIWNFLDQRVNHILKWWDKPVIILYCNTIRNCKLQKSSFWSILCFQKVLCRISKAAIWFLLRIWPHPPHPPSVAPAKIITNCRLS